MKNAQHVTIPTEPLEPTIICAKCGNTIPLGSVHTEQLQRAQREHELELKEMEDQFKQKLEATENEIRFNVQQEAEEIYGNRIDELQSVIADNQATLENAYHFELRAIRLQRQIDELKQSIPQELERRTALQRSDVRTVVEKESREEGLMENAKDKQEGQEETSNDPDYSDELSQRH